MDPTGRPEPPAANSSAPSADPERRRFLTRISIALSTFVAAVMGVPVVGFLVSPLIRKAPRVWRPVGPVDHFKVGETVNVSFEDASPPDLPGPARCRRSCWS